RDLGLPGGDPPCRALLLGALVRSEADLREGFADGGLREPGARRGHQDSRRELPGRVAVDRIERPVPAGFSGGSRGAESQDGPEGREHSMPVSAGRGHRGSLSLHVRRHADAPLIFKVGQDRLQLSQLSTQGFRNLSSDPVSFGTGVTLITGENAQGKTNLLEAVALVCGQRSFRGASLSAMAGDGERFAISANVERRAGTERIGLSWSREEGREFFRGE